MIKKSIFIILTMLLCNAAQVLSEDQITQVKINQQHQDSQINPDNRYTIGSLILTNTAVLAAAYVAVSLISTEVTLTPETKQHMLGMIPAIAAITTTGCVIVEGMNCLDHLINPSNPKKPKLKTTLAKEGIKQLFK